MAGPGNRTSRPGAGGATWGAPSSLEWWLVALIVFGYGWFDAPTNWNHIARIDPILAFVEPGTPDQYSLRIDHHIVDPVFGRNTGDWARNPEHDDHYYSNKPPGPMLLGIPAYALLYHFEAATGAVPESHAWTRVNTYALNFLISILPAALAALLFMRWLQRAFALEEREALACTLLLFFCTLIFPYATQLWGHVTAAAWIMISLYFLSGRSPVGPALAGAAIGAAVLCEYSAAISLVGMVFLLGAERRFRDLVAFGVGGLPAFAFHALYHASAFGSWLTVASAFNNPKFIEADKLVGIFGPIQTDAFFGLGFSLHHGLFVYMPILLLVVPACFMIGRGPGRNLRWLALFNVAGYLLMNLSFNGWHGGFCLGPRYLIPSLPFYVVLMIPLLRSLRDRGRGSQVAVLALCAVSLANMSLLAIRAPSTSILEERARNPLAVYYRTLLAGDLGQQRLSPVRLDGDWLAEGRVLSSRNGFLEWESGDDVGRGEGERRFRATSAIRAKQREPVHFKLGWQGSLELRVNGVALETPRHERWSYASLSAILQPGENEIEVVLVTAEAPRLYLLAFGPMAQPRLPRPDPARPEVSLAGSNWGRVLGLEGVASILPWVVGSGLLASMLLRASRDAASEDRPDL